MQYVCMKQVSGMLEALLADGSEGLILRKSTSRYVHGRSNLLWKLKAARGDMEGLVVSVDTTNHTYLLQLPDNTTFQAPSQIVEEDEMPKKGDVVTFSFENLSNRSVPVNPEIVRVRADLVWRDVVREFARNKMNDSMQKQTNYSMKPRGYWDPTRNKHMRLFFETYAKNRQLDPLVPDTWYSLTAEASLQKEARFVLAHFKGSHIKALMAVFPEIGLKETKFPFASKDYWNSVATRREVFCEFAKQQNFDPLLPENWYSVPVFSLLVYKNLRSVVEKYNGNLTKTLMHLFPDIGLDEQKLPKIPDKYYYGKDYQKNLLIFAHQNKNNKKFANSSSLDVSQDVVSLLQRGVPHHSKRHWSKAKNQKAFFEKFAKEMGFNSQVPENWYSVSGAAVLCHIGGSAILSFYESLPHALITLYPNIGLKSFKFLRLPKKYWDDTRNQKEFFDSYAEEKNFDPSVADNWYSSTFDDLLSKSATKILLKRYSGSHVQALISAYPSLNLDPHKFFSEVRENIADIDVRRQILLSYAKDKSFDALVPDNWYSTSATDILKWREKTTVLSPYRGNVTAALLHLFPNIGLDKSKFYKLPKEYWKELHNRRLFFEEFAKKHKFDPLNAHKWYPVSLENVLNMKKASSVLGFYNKDLPKALLDCFPDIGLDPTLLKRY